MVVDSPLIGAIDRALAQTRGGTSATPLALETLLQEVRGLAVEAARELDRVAVRYIAQLRLFEDLEQDKFCDALADVVVNLLGSENFVIYVADAEGGLAAVRGMGPAFQPGTSLAPSDLLSQIARSGTQRTGEHGFVALAPLQDAAGQTRGLVAIRGLLRHKPSFTEEDRQVLEELRGHAGRALGWMSRPVGTRG